MIYSVNELINFDQQQAAQFLVDTITSGELKLKHPNKDIVTFSRQSKRYRKANIISFSDGNLQNQWYMIQIYNLVDGYICEGDVVNPLNTGEIKELDTLLSQNKMAFDAKNKNTLINGLLFSQVRPYHYIYDQFINYFELDKIKPIAEYCFTDENCFYSNLPNKNKLKPIKEDGCYLFPCTKGGQYDSSSAKDMHAFIKNNSDPKHISSDLTLWFGITAQKRSWLEQASSCCKIVKQLRKHYPTITVIIDGWTSLDGGIPDSPKDIARDNAIFKLISNRMDKLQGVQLINIIGKDYKEKTSYAKSVDFFVANSGTGGMVPMMFTQAKGVIHTNGRLHTFERSYDDTIKVVPTDKIKAQEHAIDAGVYSIGWEVIYNLLTELIGIKGSIPEKKPITNEYIFTFKRFIFKKSIQLGMILKK